MATRPTAPPVAAPTEVSGVFVTSLAFRYCRPSAETVAQILRQLGTQETPISRATLEHLLMIKLLAPEESQELVVSTMPMATEFIYQLYHALTVQYYREGHR